MNMNRCFAVAAALGTFSLVYSAHADDTTTTNSVMDRDQLISSDQLYRRQELDVDLFGSASIGQQTLEHFSGSRYEHRGLWGGGGGITAYFCRYIGVGGEFNGDTRSGRFVDSASGIVYLRLPILNTGLAPYVFGGGGYQFEEVRQSFGQGGVGLEFRFCKHFGAFVDGRWIFAPHTDDSALARAGVRISF